jgi:hypothetical protein
MTRDIGIRLLTLSICIKKAKLLRARIISIARRTASTFQIWPKAFPVCKLAESAGGNGARERGAAEQESQSHAEDIARHFNEILLAWQINARRKECLELRVEENKERGQPSLLL